MSPTTTANRSLSVSWRARCLESQDDGTERLIGRAMNWRSEREGPAVPPDRPGAANPQRPGAIRVHRALVDLNNWTLLKWLDDPCPFFDWRAREAGDPVVHPADARHMAPMTVEFADGATSRVLRMRANGGGWTPIHVTVNRVELDENTFAGLVSLRLPTDEELAAAART